MNWYRVTLRMAGATASPWQADTIWGHLAWALHYIYGEAALLEIIHEYEGAAPPLLVSSGFPGDLLPRPILPPPALSASASLEEQRDRFRTAKAAKEGGWLGPAQFEAARNGAQVQGVALPDDWQPRATLKNQINRLTSTTGQAGTLFDFEEYFWPEVCIYLKVRPDFVATARDLFDYLAVTGYGKRKSVGYGQVRTMTFEEFPGFGTVPDANGFVSLANFVPRPGDPTAGYWRHLVKYGRLGEEFALPNPFKQPLIMLEAGSTFYDRPVKEYYGGFVRGLSASVPQAVQYAFAFPVPMKLPPFP